MHHAGSTSRCIAPLCYSASGNDLHLTKIMSYCSISVDSHLIDCKSLAGRLAGFAPKLLQIHLKFLKTSQMLPSFYSLSY